MRAHVNRRRRLALFHPIRDLEASSSCPSDSLTIACQLSTIIQDNTLYKVSSHLTLSEPCKRSRLTILLLQRVFHLPRTWTTHSMPRATPEPTIKVVKKQQRVSWSKFTRYPLSA